MQIIFRQSYPRINKILLILFIIKSYSAKYFKSAHIRLVNHPDTITL